MTSNSVEYHKILIGKFFKNELTKKEEEIFVKKQKDVKFTALMEEELVKLHGRQQLKNKLKDIAAQERRANRGPSFAMNKRFLYSGIAAVFVLVFGLQLVFQENLTTEEMFDNYYEPYPSVHSNQRGVTERESIYTNALEFYDQKLYSKAMIEFGKLEVAEKLNTTASFYYGMTLLSMDSLTRAKNQLSQVAEARYNPLHKEAQWYLSLLHIKEDNKEDAKRQLKELLKTSGKSKRKLIKKLLRQMD